MAKKELPEDEGPSQAWLASYADAMTLLLAFFIMMFAFALIDEGKFFDFKVGVVAALGVPDPLTDNTESILAKGTGIMPEVGLTPLTPSEAQELAGEQFREELIEAGMVTAEDAEELREYLDQQFELAGAGEFVEVGIDERGVFIRFDGRVLFDSGSAELDENGLVLLATAAEVLSIIENPLEIEGHTDNRPTGVSRWPSNWELSSARASRVVRWMIEQGELPAGRLAAIGLADTEPRASNNTPEGRQENRRVEIVTRIVDVVPADDGAGGEDADGGDADGRDADGATDPVTLEDVTTIDPIGDPIGLGDTPDLSPADGPDDEAAG